MTCWVSSPRLVREGSTANVLVCWGVLLVGCGAWCWVGWLVEEDH